MLKNWKRKELKTKVVNQDSLKNIFLHGFFVFLLNSKKISIRLSL